MRTQWAEVMEATIQWPIPPEHGIGHFDEDTRRTPVDVISTRPRRPRISGAWPGSTLPTARRGGCDLWLGQHGECRPPSQPRGVSAP